MPDFLTTFIQESLFRKVYLKGYHDNMKKKKDGFRLAFGFFYGKVRFASLCICMEKL